MPHHPTYDVLDTDTGVLLNFDGHTGGVVPIHTWVRAMNTQHSYERNTGRAATIRPHRPERYAPGAGDDEQVAQLVLMASIAELDAWAATPARPARNRIVTR